MTDEIDHAQQREQEDRNRAIAAAAHDIPAGVVGDCDMCGEYSMRLVHGACAPCRDKYLLP